MGEIIETWSAKISAFQGLKESLSKYLHSPSTESQVGSQWHTLFHSKNLGEILMEPKVKDNADDSMKDIQGENSTENQKTYEFSLMDLSFFQRIIIIAALRISLFWPCVQHYLSFIVQLAVKDFELRSLMLKDHFYYNMEFLFQDIQKASRFFTVPVVLIRLAANAGMRKFK